MSRISSARFSPLARTRIAVLALAAAAALVLSGCQGGSTPATTDSTTASPTTSATPTPSATPTAAYKPADAKGKAQNVPVPVMPELAKENTKEGLEAFVGYYFQSLSYAYETGDTQLVSAATSGTCTFCSTLTDSVTSNTKDGRWMVGGKLTTPVVESLWTGEPGSQQAKVQVLQTAIEYFDADGSVGQPSSPAINDAAAVIARYENNSWIVSDMGLIR
ncbi:DUF6318 family protein [Arthrobacter cavernae]|uniref:DUF6318 domain-containing protein n=1 Tax=Arthrobacter cavernae TaxID=2817681 RepID=A0A939KJ51_9MICC|nr:DUF6318 family protein [Arthrobacter cavernae]MBO1268302.1 hypothetical protein [Arthrobacter cavernae]